MKLTTRPYRDEPRFRVQLHNIKVNFDTLYITFFYKATVILWSCFFRDWIKCFFKLWFQEDLSVPPTYLQHCIIVLCVAYIVVFKIQLRLGLSCLLLYNKLDEIKNNVINYTPKFNFFCGYCIVIYIRTKLANEIHHLHVRLMLNKVKLILIIKELKIANVGRHWTRCHGLWDLSM